MNNDALYREVVPLDSNTRSEIERYSDWHIDMLDPEKSVLFQTRRESGEAAMESLPTKVPMSLRLFVDRMRNELRMYLDGRDADSFTIDIADARFRAQRIRGGRYALRRIRNAAAHLNELNLGEHTVRILTDPDYKNGGLLLISGETGSGKSTTAAATVVERLSQLGGYCLTMESPIECIIEGFHNNGYCEQIEVAHDEYKQEVASAMRKFPAETKSIFYFGEVLEGVAAAEIVRLAGRGHLVITTIHAKDIIRAIELLVTFAERGGESYARQLVGNNLRAVVHQQLQRGRPLVQAARISEAAKNIIANPSASLGTLVTAIEAERRKGEAARLRNL